MKMFGTAKEVQERYGLQRGYLYKLVKDGVILSASIQRPGTKRVGKKLFYFPSIEEFLRRQLEQTERQA